MPTDEKPDDLEPTAEEVMVVNAFYDTAVATWRMLLNDPRLKRHLRHHLFVLGRVDRVMEVTRRQVQSSAPLPGFACVLMPRSEVLHSLRALGLTNTIEALEKNPGDETTGFAVLLTAEAKMVSLFTVVTSDVPFNAPGGEA